LEEKQDDSGKRYGRFGDYDVIEKIGHGAFGKVYRAWDSTADRQVALKILRSREDFPDDVVARFRREAQALAKINHKNIVRIYHVIQDQSTLGICMEFLTGKTLSQHLDDHGALPCQEVAQIGRALCSALGAVHAAGFVHRDVKGENLMILDDPETTGRRVVLMDFGITRPLNDSAKLTAPGILVGTPVAMAPEQHESGTIDCRADIYAVGSLLYRLLTKQFPFTAISYPELRRKVLVGDYASITEHRADVPEELRNVIGRAMARNPDDRFQMAHDMERALEAFLGEAPTSGGQVSAVATSGNQRTVVALLGAILAALIVLIWIVLTR